LAPRCGKRKKGCSHTASEEGWIGRTSTEPVGKGRGELDVDATHLWIVYPREVWIGAKRRIDLAAGEGVEVGAVAPTARDYRVDFIFERHWSVI
jgi:hypothetical protein